MIRQYHPTFLVILQTHVPFFKLSNFCSNIGYNLVHIIEAQGHSGGIWLLQSTTTSQTSTVIDFNNFSITFTVQYDAAITTCTSIYASPNHSIRSSLWNHLSTLNQNISGPWMLIGDFNETLLPSDQRGGIFNQSRAATFSTFMDNYQLLDITTIGGRYTWHRNNNDLRILSKKLDIGLANVSWRIAFPETFVEILCRLHSDHNPILLRFGGLPLARGPRPFRFEAAWIDHEEYANLVDKAWNSSNHNTITSLSKVRDNSIIFNHEVFGNIFRRKQRVVNRLKGVQKYLERVDSLRHVLLEKELQQEYNHILFQEEMHWYQKSREQWVKFGDKNSSFFPHSNYH